MTMATWKHEIAQSRIPRHRLRHERNAPCRSLFLNLTGSPPMFSPLFPPLRGEGFPRDACRNASVFDSQDSLAQKYVYFCRLSSGSSPDLGSPPPFSTPPSFFPSTLPFSPTHLCPASKCWPPLVPFSWSLGAHCPRSSPPVPDVILKISKRRGYDTLPPFFPFFFS